MESDTINHNRSELSEEQVIAKTSAALNPSLQDFDLMIKDYGEYAIILASTKDVLTQLKSVLHKEDAQMIYVLSVLCLIQEEYTSAGS